MFGTTTLSKPSPPQSSDDPFVDNDNNVSPLPRTMTTAPETIGRHEKTIRDLKAKLATSNDEKGRLGKDLHSTQGDWEEESRSCGIEQMELRVQAQEAKDRCGTLESENDRHKAEIQELKAEIDELTAKNASLSSWNTRLRGLFLLDNASLASVADDTDSLFDRLQRQIGELREQVNRQEAQQSEDHEKIERLERSSKAPRRG
jgi:chromosome segregation ATPase